MSILTADDHMPHSITHKHKTRDRKKDPRCSHIHALVHAEPAALVLLASSRTTPDDNASAAA